MKMTNEKDEKLKEVYRENSIYARSSGNLSQIANLLKKKFEINKMSSLKKHPNMIYDFFEDINTKDKAYWLGFIYADGHISKNLDRFRFTLGIKDKNHLEKFCNTLNIDTNTIKEEKSRISKSNFSVLSIYNQKIVRDLLYHGVVPAKTKIIELPKLKNRELYMAFLLGYFDGDGTQGTSRIKSASKIFFEQICNYFKINFQITLVKEKKRIKNINNEIREFEGKCFLLYIGARLFNELLDNYQNSMERKRYRFKTEEERITKIKAQSWKGYHKRKFLITREELENLVYIIPKIKIGEKFGVSGRTVSNWCKKWRIVAPIRGDWAKIYGLKINPKSKKDWIKIINFKDRMNEF